MTIDLTPVLQAVLGLCALVLTTFGTMLIQAAAKRWHLQITAQQTAAFDDALSKSLQFGVTTSLDTIKAKGWDHVDTKSQVVGSALNYAVAQFPGALQSVGLTTDMTDPKNVSTITNALNRALPAAFSVAAASPATPAIPGAVSVAQVATATPAASTQG